MLLRNVCFLLSIVERDFKDLLSLRIHYPERNFGKPEIALDPEQVPQRLRASKPQSSSTEGAGQAEQFALRATFDGWYPCYSCGSVQEIYLHCGEIWKYGYIRAGKYNRYASRWLQRMQLDYRIQYMGKFADCRKLCHEKIATYAGLPENLSREYQLILPPANPSNH